MKIIFISIGAQRSRQDVNLVAHGIHLFRNSCNFCILLSWKGLLNEKIIFRNKVKVWWRLFFEKISGMPPYQPSNSITPRGTLKYSVSYTLRVKKLIPTAFSLITNYHKSERLKWFNENGFRKIIPVKSFNKRRGPY